MERSFIDFHVIQTVPPSCINRDDSNSPKTAIYGGVLRARVSSQCWKYAMRKFFREHFDEDQLSVRTKKIVELVIKEIEKLDPSLAGAPATRLAEDVISQAGIKLSEPDEKRRKKDAGEPRETGALFFMSKWQAANLATLAVNGNTDRKDAKDALCKGHGVDIALFGRMVADDSMLKVSASSQVAHAISTHHVDNDFDFFTAMDEMAPVAGMLSTTGFNSSTLYRYAALAVHVLHDNLGNGKITSQAVAEFARAFIMSMPTGKQNSFANRNLPDAVMVTMRHDQPVSLAGAFEEPVKLAGGGYKSQSIQKMEEYALFEYSNYVKPPVETYVIGDDFDRLAGVSPVKRLTVDELVTLLSVKNF